MSLPDFPKGRFNIVARLEAKGDKEAEEIGEVLARLVKRANSDEEPNTLYYKAHRSLKNPRLFVVYEEYDNKGANVALDNHTSSPDFQALLKLIPTHSTSGLELDILEAL
ncbi:hypothetical protein ACQY0O_005889 [Thecaphora frezii]